MIIVTGGAGFIGSNLVQALNERGRTDILVVDDLEAGQKFQNLSDLRISDYMDRQEFRSRLDQGKLGITPDFVLHQGACSDPLETDGRFMLENNFTDSKALLHYCLLHKVPMVYASSGAIYGSSPSSKVDPAHERPQSLFAYSKLLFDQHVRSLVPHTQSTLMGLRYFSVYGPREQHKEASMSLPSRLLRELREEGLCRVPEDSLASDLIHVQDIVDINLQLAGGELRKGLVNVGTGVVHHPSTVAQTLVRLLGTGRIEELPPVASTLGEDQAMAPADLQDLREAGYRKPFKPLEEGLAALIRESGN